MALVFDTTGNNPLYRINGLRYRIEKPSGTNGYTLMLPQDAFIQSFNIQRVNADGTTSTMSNGTDYSFPVELRDETMENQVKAAVPTYQPAIYGTNLYKGVYIANNAFNKTANFTDFIIGFQSVTPNILTSAIDSVTQPGGPQCTPELLKAIVEDLLFLKEQMAGEDVNYSSSGSLPTPLSVDYTGILDDNYIIDEEHQVQGKAIIRPANGSFYDSICSYAWKNSTGTKKVYTYTDTPSIYQKAFDNKEFDGGGETISTVAKTDDGLNVKHIVIGTTVYLRDADDDYWTDGLVVRHKTYTAKGWTNGGTTIYTDENPAVGSHAFNNVGLSQLCGEITSISSSKTDITVNNTIFTRDLNKDVYEGTVLKREVDYTVRGMDTAATKVCENASGVWRYICLLKPITGMVYVDYHAFGGEVSIQNFITIKNQVQDLKDYIDKGSFLTAGTLGGAALMQEVLERLKTLDQYYRTLNMSGYRDMFHRFYAKKPSVGVNASHWYTIAHLYKQVNDTSDDTYFPAYTKDSLRCKVRLEYNNVLFDLLIYANVKSETLDVKVLEMDSDNGFSKPANYKGLAHSIIPQFRLVWRTDGDYNYGASLQIKTPVPADKEYEIITVENHNKAGIGGWILKGNGNGTEEAIVEDNQVLLPYKTLNANTTGADYKYWVDGNASCKSATFSPIYSNGLLIWAGSVGMHTMDAEFGTSDMLDLHPCIDYTLSCTGIKSVTVCVFDRVNKCYIYRTVDVHAINDDEVKASMQFDDLDNCYAILKIGKASDKPTLGIKTILGTKSFMMQRFDLRQISINVEGE